MSQAKSNFVSTLGFAVREQLSHLGHAARLFIRLLVMMGPALKRFGLVRDQIFFLGNYSLAIIGVSGLFVGFVLGLQGYYTLQRFGAADTLGLLVTLSLVRELGPPVSLVYFMAPGLRGEFQQDGTVPEPETYAMLLAGLAMVGALARRRKQV